MGEKEPLGGPESDDMEFTSVPGVCIAGDRVLMRSLVQQILQAVFISLYGRCYISVAMNSEGREILASSTPIVAAVPSIKYCLKNGARSVVLLCSTSQPAFLKNKNFDTEPVSGELKALIGEDVFLFLSSLHQKVL